MKHLLIFSALLIARSCSKQNSQVFNEINIQSGDRVLISVFTNSDTVGSIESYFLPEKLPMRKCTFYRNGGVMSIEIYTSDSTLTTRRYYPSGILKSEYFLKLDRKNDSLNKLDYKKREVSLLMNAIHIDTHRYYNTAGVLERVEIYDSKGFLVEESSLSDSIK